MVGSSDKRDGHIWNAEDVKAHIFEPFFTTPFCTTKDDWKGASLFTN